MPSLAIAPQAWLHALPALLLLLERGDANGRQYAKQELRRMARIADKAVAALTSPEA